MKINIVSLNYEDEKRVHLSKRAWNYSRTNDDSEENDILGLNLPVNEIPNAVLEIESTIIEREIIASMRDHHMWARSSRVDDPLKFEIPDVIKDDLKFARLVADSISMMVEAKEISRQDEYRMFMPAIALSKFTLSLNLRSLIILYKFFNKLSSYKDTPNFPPEISNNAAIQLAKVITEMRAGMVDTNRYPEVNLLPEVKEMTSGRVGGFITYSGYISLSLRSHLIRHRMLFMNDNLLEIILSPAFDHLTLETKVKVNITSSIEFWKRIVSTRSCWLTHYRMWKEIIDEVSKYIDEDIENVLPCANCKCPFSVDNEARLEERDPNPPCPIYVSQNNIITNKKTIDRMMDQVLDDRRPTFWGIKINSARKIWSGE